MTTIRLRCLDCKHTFNKGEELTAPSPFRAGDTLHACAECCSVSDFERLCDEPGCDCTASGGTPWSGGYKFHCRSHPPRKGASHDSV